ncbi:MAG: MerR family transcriptional regulator [Propionibacterium sp.]|nr:MerR family transcriptional regulator [Propionibacterium sp.]
MKIGEVAEHTGLSVRTLRHYDELGIVTPSSHTQGGFRLYSTSDVEQLLLVRRMKPLEFSLEEMRRFLEATGTLGRDDATPDARHDAAVTVEWFRDETVSRLARLRTRVGYAEEFLALVDELPHRTD